MCLLFRHLDFSSDQFILLPVLDCSLAGKTIRPAFDLETLNYEAISHTDLTSRYRAITLIDSWFTSESSYSLKCSFSYEKQRIE